MKRLIREIHRRSLWQVLGIYLVGAWAVLQVVDTLSGALRLPDWAAPLAFVLLIIGLPIVVATAFVQEGGPGQGTGGEPGPEEAAEGGPDESGAAGSGGAAPEAPNAPGGAAPDAVPPGPSLPAGVRRLLTWRNALLGLAGALLLLFGVAGLYVVIRDRGRSPGAPGDNPLMAATTTVTLEDTTGATIEREVPRAEFRRSVAVFALENASADPDLDWLRYGIPTAVWYDLLQDMFVRVMTPYDEALDRGLHEAGIDDSMTAPLPLERKLAAERNLDALLTGAFGTSDSGLVANLELYDVARGRRIASHTIAALDVFALADRISVQIKEDLGIPAGQIEDTEDLPVSEIATRSEDAFRDFVLGTRSEANGEFEKAARSFGEAVETDPTFALAWWLLAECSLLLNRPEDAASAMQTGRQYLYKLPERTQLNFRVVDAMVYQHEPDRALETAKYWVELYPADAGAHTMLANQYLVRRDWAKRIDELEAILAIDPSRREEIEQIGLAYEMQARYDSALAWYGRYAELAPDDYRASMDVGDVQRRMGRHDAARASYERALLVEPGEVEVLGRLITLEAELGDFGAAERRAEEALAASRLPGERADVYGRLEEAYYLQGRFERLVANYRDRAAELAASGTPLPAMSVSQSRALVWAPEAGRATWATRQLDSLRARLPSPYSDMLGFLMADVSVQSGDTVRARAEIQQARKGAASIGLESLAPYLSYLEGALAEAGGDCQAAVAFDREASAGGPTEREFRTALARCQRKLGQLEDAEATLLDVLKVVPADAKARYQLALVYEAMGRTPDAVEQLEKAVDIWKDADPEYVPAREARTKLAELAP